MLLTVKDLAQELQIKPATLYSWAAQQKIPFIKIHGVIRFERERINEWLKTFAAEKRSVEFKLGADGSKESVEVLIDRAKRSVYSSARGNQTSSEPKKKGGVSWGS